MRTDECGELRKTALAKAEFGIAGKRSGKGSAGFGRRQVEPWPIEQPFRQQLPRDRKAKQFEIAAIGDLKRLRRIGKRQVARCADLFVAALRGSAEAFELKVDEAKIVRA